MKNKIYNIINITIFKNRNLTFTIKSAIARISFEAGIAIVLFTIIFNNPNLFSHATGLSENMFFYIIISSFFLISSGIKKYINERIRISLKDAVEKSD